MTNTVSKVSCLLNAGLSESELFNIKISKCVAGGCGIPTDLGIVLDSSGSIRLKNWKKILVFLEELLDGLGASPNDLHVAIMEYSIAPIMVSTFRDDQSKEELKKAALLLSYLRNTTRSDLAMKAARETMFSAKLGARLHARKIILLVTDGRTHGKLCAYFIRTCHVIGVCLPSQSASEKNNQEKKVHKPLRISCTSQITVSAMFDDHTILLF